MTPPVLHLIVLRASDLERTARFYSGLGFSLASEKHGSGPQHYSCETGGVVLELYPAGKIGAEPGAGMLGFSVKCLKAALSVVEAEGCSVLLHPGSSERGLRAVVLDPDGRKLELVEPRREG
ncbi:VOC family protein [Sorangium sp. So ce1182]|uniref:VOC family protein n=1 Tax=Sorangium sp. So ce1182 TaxID=3133334 RepID=UPI003F5E8DF5